ncbi:hypothetical protein Glove_48g73 [Diversispora epigaea]|uniref:Ion transport domain-containing protein n=1 Tax=Diversispora epigaea TaxID=1348612 RepID=A0A397JNW0_9GLOM|nr:hypothetical protein Glove_48g73 [Diversispora epigaea]
MSEKRKKNDLPEETLSSTSSIEKDFLFLGSCIAISPDSQLIVTFNSETHKFKLYDIVDSSSIKHIFTFECFECGVNEVNDKRLCWSIAISDRVDDGGNERLIALSCFYAREFRHDDKVNNGDDGNDLESGVKVNNQYDDNCFQPQTWIISTKDRSEIYTSFKSIGGVIRFLDSDDNDDSDDSDSNSDYSDQPLKLKNKLLIIIVNASGIFKETIRKKRKTKIERFKLPQQLSNRLSRDWKDSLELLHTYIIKNHFMVHSFENRQQIIEMYSLITGDLEMLFKRHEPSVAPNIIRGSPIFAISQNEKILAFCWGTTSITLYFMENGLEITTKQLEGRRGIYKIVAINFIDADSKLLIFLEEKENPQVGILKHQIFVVWDLFTTYENSIRQIDYSLKMDVTYRLMNSHGKMFAVTDNGDIFSVLDHPDVASIRNSSTKAMTNIGIDITTTDHVYHVIYTINGKRCDTLEKNQIIIDNDEPWHPNKNYFRISVYLDSTKRTQFIISSNTIQVWKYRNNNTIEKRDKRRDRTLEYIWARNKVIDVRELRIGKREFVLKVSVPSTKRSTSKTITIHWPNNVNVLEGACQALYVLGEKKHIVTDQENVNEIKYLIECTQILIRKYITKYGIFRLTSIRYPIMKYLIKSYQESLIKHILNKKINTKNSNIYIPRLYKWVDEDNNRSTIEISKSDLHHAILCIQKRGDSTVILKYLIDYYTDNTKEYNNHGWMFTVSKAIPLLYDAKLTYTPPLHINSYDQKKGNNAAVIHSLIVSPCLAPKFHNTLWFFSEIIFTRWYYRFQTSRNNRKVYIVPLPDFTVCPNPKGLEDHSKDYSKFFLFILTLFRISLWPRRKVINNTKKMSPFLRVIHEEDGHEEEVYEIYKTPTIMAVLDFKWSATRRYFIRHIIIDGWSRYMNIYNMFDLVSVLLPLADNIVSILYDHQVLIFFNPVLAFTALVMWLELLLLLRYFEGPGRFIYIIKSILKAIRPFFAFMLIVVLAFGHAMFILLDYDVDKSFRFGNYYSDFISSVEPVFFWTNGRWDNLDQWDSYAVDVMSILGSIILVLFFQNKLIAFMNGAFNKANEESRIAAHRYRAELVAEYEALEKPFDSKRGNPQYIYYIPDPDVIDTWLKETKKDENSELELTDFDYSDDDDDNDDDSQDNSFYSKKYRHIQNEGSSSTMDLDSIEPITDKYNGSIIDKILFIDEENFQLKVVTSKSNKKSQRNWKSNNKLLKNVSYNKQSDEPLSEDPGFTTSVDDQLSMQERFNNLENEFKTRFNNLETRFDELEQNLKTILKTLNNLNNHK